MVKLQVRRRRADEAAARAAGAGGSCGRSWAGASTPTRPWAWWPPAMIAVLLVRRRTGRLPLVVPADAGGHGRRCDRRHPGAKVRIKEAVPSFDGRRLDDIIDFLTYTFLPLCLICRAGSCRPGTRPGSSSRCWPASTASARSRPRPTTAISSASRRSGTSSPCISTPCRSASGPRWRSWSRWRILTFVPSRYLYPSLPGKFNRFISILGIPWTIALVWIIFKLPDDTGPALDPTTLQVAWASLSYPILYLGASWLISVAHWHEAAGRPSGIRGLPSAMSPSSSAIGSALGGLVLGARQPLAFRHVDQREQQRRRRRRRR